MGRVPLPGSSFWCEAGSRLMSATSIIGCECEPWPRVKGEDAASWIKDPWFRSANFTPIRQRAGKCISAHWVYQKDLWGLWPFCKPNMGDVLSQSLSLFAMTHQSLQKVHHIHRDPMLAMPSALCRLLVLLSSREPQLWVGIVFVLLTWVQREQVGPAASHVPLPPCGVSCLVAGKWLETLPCPV